MKKVVLLIRNADSTSAEPPKIHVRTNIPNVPDWPDYYRVVSDTINTPMLHTARCPTPLTISAFCCAYSERGRWCVLLKGAADPVSTGPGRQQSLGLRASFAVATLPSWAWQQAVRA